MSKYLSSDFGKELLGVVIVVLIVGLLLHHGTAWLYGAHDLNNMTVYGMHLIATGVASHLVCELFGINHWYCKSGVACRG